MTSFEFPHVRVSRRARRLTMVLVSALMVVAACSSPGEPSGEEEMPAADFTQVATSMVEDLAAGAPSTMHDAFSENLAGQLSQDQLVEAWQQTLQLTGECRSVHDVTTREEQGLSVVEVIVDCETQGMAVTLSFSSDGEVEGVWFAPAPPVDSTDQGARDATLPDGATEIAVQVGDHALAGLVTVPAEETAADGPTVAVLLVAGSGPNDRDGTLGAAGNAPLRDLAHQLAAAGVPSLRYDKRFHADPSSAAADETIQAEVLDDVAAAIDLLASHPAAADRDVVVLGHSLGGMLVPAIATDSPAVAGAVILAGTPRTLWEVIRDQNHAVIEGSSADAATAAEQRDEVDAEVDRANALTDPDAEPILGSIPASYVVSLNELELAETASTLGIPLLVLQGDADFQVSVERDFEAWQDVLAEVPDVTYEVFPGLNHLFMETSGLEGAADYDVAGEVAPEVTESIVGWMTDRW